VKGPGKTSLGRHSGISCGKKKTEDNWRKGVIEGGKRLITIIKKTGQKGRGELHLYATVRKRREPRHYGLLRGGDR